MGKRKNKMITITKNLFLPTEENEGLPLFLSAFSATLFGVLAAFLILSPAGIRQYQLAQLLGGPTFAPADVIRLANADRSANGLGTLRENDLLNQAAAAKAADMSIKDYFAHVNPDGKTPWDFIRGAGYKYTAAGENLAIDFLSAESAENAFMASPTHRANILNKLYTEMGVAVLSGAYQGRPSIFVVQYFGKPMTAAVQAPKITNLSGAGVLAKLAVPPAKKTVLPPAKTEVLGTENSVKPAEIPVIPENSLNISVRIIGFLVIFVLLVALAMALVRLRALRFGVLARTLALIIIFGYIATHDVVKVEGANITPISFSTVVPAAR